MTALRLASTGILLVALGGAGWWVATNRARPKIGQGPPQQSSAAHPVNTSQVNSQATAPAAVTTALAAGETEQRLGPFPVAGKNYTVLLRKKKRRPGPTQETGETVVAMEIRDAGDTILYQRAFPYQSGDVEFSDSWSVFASVVKGTSGNGLMVSYDLDSEPSAPEPESSGWYQVFGVVNGKLTPFSGPIMVQGGLYSGDRTSRLSTPAAELDLRSDTLNFKVWAQHFRLIFPLRIDWNLGKMRPIQACAKAPARGSSQLCEYSVTPEEERRTGEPTFVQFCADSAGCNNPERVLVKKDSKVELVSCVASVMWSEGLYSGPTGKSGNPMEDQGGISVSTENVRLKVRIDGKEGWMYKDEDFYALGLPFEQ